MRKAAVCVFIAALLGGCGTAHVKRYFQVRSLDTGEPALPRVERRLLVEPVAVDPLYDDLRILYRVSAFELKYYPYEFWAEKPGKQFGDALAATLVKKKVFPSISRDGGAGAGGGQDEPEILLRARVRVLEEIDSPDVWEARLAMDLGFIDAKTGKAVVSSSFDRRGQMAKGHVGDLPAVLSRILDEELGKAVWELARALEKK